ncbi:hypothetical protein [Dactylosporangium sp. CA-139066]|uniref:hypothetical protein n=1 Tax=Dactylosporangium sp. CA-139066 TaxID=3239930 RepID=UPI003D91F679
MTNLQGGDAATDEPAPSQPGKTPGGKDSGRTTALVAVLAFILLIALIVVLLFAGGAINNLTAALIGLASVIAALPPLIRAINHRNRNS